jgi:transposase-like protein
MHDFRNSSANGALRKVLKRLHYPLEVILTCVRWYVAYPLCLRHIEEMMQERGVFVDYAMVHRWAIKMLPVLVAVFRRGKCLVGKSWRMDEIYIKVSGQWEYLYRAVDRDGDTIDVLLAAKRDLAAARRFLERSVNLHDLPETITVDRSGANAAAIERVEADACVDILLRQCKYLNNIVEQDHRVIKRITGPMLGFKSFWSALKVKSCPQQISSTAWPFDHKGNYATLLGHPRYREKTRQSRLLPVLCRGLGLERRL